MNISHGQRRRPLLGVLFVAPDVYAIYCLVIVIGIWFAAGHVNTTVFSIWVVHTMPMTFPSAYVSLLFMAFPVVDLTAKLVMSLYGFTLAIAAAGGLSPELTCC